ncbi:MAG: hypothetical protein EP330_17970 [Deltaproteobacteria bacterium]|nr:MAG: hypothetical protein EP330_17970 [Deltaproteobacteria bacterium]
MADVIRVHPPGPYPPHGREVPGEVDLGIRLRELMYTRHAVTGWARRALSDRLGVVARDPMRLAMASGWIDDLPTTWPLGAMIDDARERWTQGPDGEALAVLLRASHLMSPVLGWPTSIDRRWPMPDPDWVKGQIPEGASVRMVPRGRADGTAGLAIVLDAEVEAGGIAESRVLAAGIDEIESDPERFVQALADGVSAIQITTPGPSTEDQHVAWERVREAGDKQLHYERGGLAGLTVDELPRFDELLGEAPSGTWGDRLVASADVLFLPTISQDGSLGVVGVVAWDGPYHPIRVVPGAAEIIRNLDGKSTLDQLAANFEIDSGSLRDILDQLVELGAATAAE